MASLKEIRTRITSVNSTKQITSAMKMVAAARLKKSQDAILKMRPYADKLRQILEDLSSSLDTAEENVYADQREVKNVLIVIVTSNRGLCGGFNSNVIKAVKNLLQDKYAGLLKKDKVHFMAVGKKGADFLKAGKLNMISNQSTVFDDLSFGKVTPIAESIMKRFAEKKFDRVEIVYNQFKNAAVQNLVVEQFLPIQINQEEGGNRQMDYIFEPSKEYIVNDLIPKSLKVQFFKAVLDSFASEHGARMTAMHQATDNATELIKELKLNYNKARQAAITKEILEIVSGAEALKG
jgi:F-type H+-transporting ATPase subunit gamma